MEKVSGVKAKLMTPKLKQKGMNKMYAKNEEMTGNKDIDSLIKRNAKLRMLGRVVK